jgi:hypothetical protein
MIKGVFELRVYEGRVYFSFLNNNIILQKHLIYLKKIFCIVRNLKNKNESFPSLFLLNP